MLSGCYIICDHYKLAIVGAIIGTSSELIFNKSFLAKCIYYCRNVIVFKFPKAINDHSFISLASFNCESIILNLPFGIVVCLIEGRIV